jgi:hypothetical protein
MEDLDAASGLFFYFSFGSLVYTELTIFLYVHDYHCARYVGILVFICTLLAVLKCLLFIFLCALLCYEISPVTIHDLFLQG